jgi:hypothetical protein
MMFRIRTLSVLLVLSVTSASCRRQDAASSLTPETAIPPSSTAEQPVPQSSKEPDAGVSEANVVPAMSSPPGNGTKGTSAGLTGAAGGASLSAAQLPTAAAARTAAASWLIALAAEDAKALELQSSPSLDVTGFWGPNMSDRSRCGRSLNSTEHQARVADGFTPKQIADCLVNEVVLVHTIPRYSATQWPDVISAPDSKRRVGYLKPLDLQAMPTRLERYREPLTAAAKESTLLTFFVTDNSGVTAYGAMAVRQTENGSRVASVFIDQRFEE